MKYRIFWLFQKIVCFETTSRVLRSCVKNTSRLRRIFWSLAGSRPTNLSKEQASIWSCCPGPCTLAEISVEMWPRQQISFSTTIRSYSRVWNKMEGTRLECAREHHVVAYTVDSWSAICGWLRTSPRSTRIDHRKKTRENVNERSYHKPKSQRHSIRSRAERKPRLPYSRSRSVATASGQELKETEDSRTS